jgi:hypothetical protein
MVFTTARIALSELAAGTESAQFDSGPICVWAATANPGDALVAG